MNMSYVYMHLYVQMSRDVYPVAHQHIRLSLFHLAHLNARAMASTSSAPSSSLSPNMKKTPSNQTVLLRVSAAGEDSQRHTCALRTRLELSFRPFISGLPATESPLCSLSLGCEETSAPRRCPANLGLSPPHRRRTLEGFALR